MTLFQGLGIWASGGAGAAAAPGMVLLTPTSIAYSGTSASVGANGQVTFSAVTSLSLNGVFSATYDNYVVSIRGTASANTALTLRLRVAGTDNNTANSYTTQRLIADNTNVTAGRFSDQPGGLSAIYAAQRNGITSYFYGPYLVQPTAVRSVAVTSYLNAYYQDEAFTHNQSTSYDGFTIFPSGVITITGALQVYGVRS